MSVASDALGLAVSVVAPSFAFGNLLAMAFVLIWLNLCGFFVNKASSKCEHEHQKREERGEREKRKRERERQRERGVRERE